MLYTATISQVWHEIQRQPRFQTAVIDVKLTRNDASPYRVRGVAVFDVFVTLPWFANDTVALITDDGRRWLPTWQQFGAALPELAVATTGLTLKIELASDAVAWAPNLQRDNRRSVALSEARAGWSGVAAELRAEWVPRRRTDRRAAYLAAADGLALAIDFDRARGIVI